MGSVCVVAGTRPEIIKLAPVYRKMREGDEHDVFWLSTGQHTDLAEQTLDAFAIRPDVKLRLAAPNAAKGRADSLARVFADLVARIDEVLARLAPSLVVVQGDTTSAVAAAFAAFSRQIPVAHVEAGLRTFDLARPFPEEGWRSVLTQLSTLHFAPTKTAARNLQRCGLRPDSIRVTGNTVIDALHWLVKHVKPDEPIRQLAKSKRLVVVTLHRRENWNGGFGDVCSALLALRDGVGDIEICFVQHANPALQQQAARHLADQPRVHLQKPLAYPQFVQLLRGSTLILTDSGGVQEEAPALGVPVLILRDSTERPEAVEEGVAKLVGTDPARILKAATRLLTDRAAYSRMARRVNPFGDGQAASRIARDIEYFLATGSMQAAKTAA